MMHGHETAVLEAVANDGAGLCTLVGIDGSFSRRLGAQLAVRTDGGVTGSLADGCLERQLAAEMEAARAASEPRLLRFGSGSPLIDFRLPCGGGLDVLVEPAPDQRDCRTVLERLARREPAVLSLPLPANAAPGLLSARRFLPPLRLTIFGEGPEADGLVRLTQAMGIGVRLMHTDALRLGQAPDLPPPDGWTAVVLLFHDHEWELPLLEWALAGAAFYIGAQGGAPARRARMRALMDRGADAAALARMRSPIGLIGHARDPAVLALSVLAEIVGAYDTLQPHQ